MPTQAEGPEFSPDAKAWSPPLWRRLRGFIGKGARLAGRMRIPSGNEFIFGGRTHPLDAYGNGAVPTQRTVRTSQPVFDPFAAMNFRRSLHARRERQRHARPLRQLGVYGDILKVHAKLRWRSPHGRRK